MTAAATIDPKVYRVDRILDEAGVFDEALEAQLQVALMQVPIEILEKTPTTMDPSVLIRLISLCLPAKGKKILSIGVEQGLASAVLSALKVSSFAVESDASRAQIVRRFLDSSGFSSALTRVSPVSKGWPEFALFDAVLVLGLPDKIDKELFRQLSPKNGRLCCLTGDTFVQTVSVWEKSGLRLVKTDFELVQGYTG